MVLINTSWMIFFFVFWSFRFEDASTGEASERACGARRSPHACSRAGPRTKDLGALRTTPL